jgi:1-phosphatidylinositol-4-phosphate 5-kinase
LDITYKGYVDKDDQREGVGMTIWADGYKDKSEWHLNKLHGCAKVEYVRGASYWGEYKDGKEEGYGTWEGCYGDRYIG